MGNNKEFNTLISWNASSVIRYWIFVEWHQAEIMGGQWFLPHFRFPFWFLGRLVTCKFLARERGGGSYETKIGQSIHVSEIKISVNDQAVAVFRQFWENLLMKITKIHFAPKFIKRVDIFWISFGRKVVRNKPSPRKWSYFCGEGAHTNFRLGRRFKFNFDIARRVEKHWLGFIWSLMGSLPTLFIAFL